MKGRVLLVDDEKTICDVLKMQLVEEGYTVEVAANGKEGLEKVPQFQPEVIVSDVAMPIINGIEFCKKIKETESTRFIPVMIMTTLTDRVKRYEALEAGADEFLNKPVDTVEMLTRLRALIRMKRLIDELEDGKNIIRMLANTIEAKDGYTGKHVERVAQYALALAKKAQVPEEMLRTIEMGALLHDIGKIGVPESILCKPSALNEEEFNVIKTHPTMGVEICHPLRFLKEMLKVIRYHHERYDGEGYPEGLKGEAIPLEARIVAIADAYDALTSDRSYRKGMLKKKAIAVLKEGRGTQWDAKLIDHFIEFLEKEL